MIYGDENAFININTIRTFFSEKICKHNGSFWFHFSPGNIFSHCQINTFTSDSHVLCFRGSIDFSLAPQEEKLLEQQM